MNTKLYVGNLSTNTTENDLQDAFAAHGTVMEANLMTDRDTGRPRGFAFVTMGSAEEAQNAITALNGASLDGRNLTVNEARPKTERSSGGNGGRDFSRRHSHLQATLGTTSTSSQFLGGDDFHVVRDSSIFYQLRHRR